MRLVTRMILDAIHKAIENGADIEWAEDYAEPGYQTNSEHGIFFANWNPKEFGPPEVPTVESRIGRILDALGIDIEWSDEWVTCDDCLRAVRTEPDSYLWLPSYVIFDGHVTCRECLEDDPEALEDHLTNNPAAADTFAIEWDARGWTRHEPPEFYETGFHSGQTDKPEEVMATLHREGFDRVLFQIVGKGQFDVRWIAWVKRPEED